MKIIMSIKTLGAAVSLMLGSPLATAADTGVFYIGADVGSTEFSGDGPGRNSVFTPGQAFKDSDTGYGVHGGFQFNAWFALELAYTDFGSATDHYKIRPDIAFIVAPNDTQTVEAQGISLAGAFSYGIGERFTVMGSLGISSLHFISRFSGGFSEATGSLLEGHRFSDQGLIYGIGARYAFTNSVNIRIELRRNDIGDFSLDRASLGLEYSF